MKDSRKRVLIILEIVPMVIALVWLLISMGICNLPETAGYTYERGKIVPHSWHDLYDEVCGVFFAVILIVNLAVLLLSLKLNSGSKRKWLKSVLMNLGVGFVSIVLLFIGNVVVTGVWNEQDYDPQYYEFTNEERRIVIEEKSYLLKGIGTIYQIESDNTAEVVGEFSIDDGGRNNGDYEVRWMEKCAEITYHTFADKNSVETIRVELE